VVGPITLLLGWLIRAWCKRSLFDAHDRWDSVRAFAWCFGLLTALALAICAFIISPGQAFHLWTHSPLRALGAPDLFSNLWLRWVVSVPLAFALALSMSWGETRLVRRFTRIPTEREQHQLAEKRREQEERVRREQQAERERAARLAEATKRAPTAAPKTTRATLTASASPPANRTEHSASPPLQPSGATITPATGQGKPTL
jgi:membrane protein implicated in regulation of membrane protease activity